MWAMIRTAILSLLVLTLVTGVAYPLVVTGLAQLLFPTAANGSVLMREGKPVGSALIGQPFSDPRYFWGRPSATASFPYNGDASGGSNLGPTNPALADAVKQRIATLRAADPGNTKPVPVDLVTASGSGLDPQISPAAAEFQVERVARARGLRADDVRKAVASATQKRQWRIFGEPRVNVLQLNLALDGK
ncbi:MAG: potassium-transporting ATPase subunit KdpC [Rhodanobacteraceae bacterium]